MYGIKTLTKENLLFDTTTAPIFQYAVEEKGPRAFSSRAENVVPLFDSECQMEFKKVIALTAVSWRKFLRFLPV